MPLPRFERLPVERQAEVLGVAQRHLAREGRSQASYNQIIAEAGLSKTSAYLYFDGREDLVRAVLARVVARLEAVLGPWTPVESAAAFWAQLTTQSAALREHLATNAEELALVSELEPNEWPQAQAWLEAMLENGRALGVVRRDVPAAVMREVTRAVFNTLDGLAVAALRSGGAVDEALGRSLLEGLWRSPR
jgi:AcrR family transcriptional regulator